MPARGDTTFAAPDPHGALTGEAGSAGRAPRPPLGKSKALALARVATPESLPAWLDVARESTIRTLRAQARAAVKAGGGAQPPMPMEDAGWQASVRREPGMARRRIARLGVRALACPDPDVFLRLTLPSDLGGCSPPAWSPGGGA